MANFCELCGNKVGLFSRIKIKDGYICSACQKKSLNISNCDCRTVQDYKDRFAYLEENKTLFSNFNPTTKIQKFLQVDENNKLFKIGKSEECFPFEYLNNFELIEDGETLTSGGLGRAVVGGAFLGATGAIVGGITGKKKSKAVINKMYIRISLNDKWIKTANISLIDVETRKSGMIYNGMKTIANDIVSSLENIIKVQQNESNNSSNTQQLSAADEILKFKQLLDNGIITEEEFNKKKTQLLGI